MSLLREELLELVAQLGIIVAALIQVNEHLTMEEFAEEAKVQAAAPAVMKKKNQEGKAETLTQTRVPQPTLSGNLEEL